MLAPQLRKRGKSHPSPVISYGRSRSALIGAIRGGRGRPSKMSIYRSRGDNGISGAKAQNVSTTPAEGRSEELHEKRKEALRWGYSADSQPPNWIAILERKN